MKKIIIAAVALIIIPTLAYANIVWPALMLETRLFSWWAIAVGLIIEYLAIRWIFDFTAKRAVIADISANAISAIAGLLLIPIGGLAWEIFPASIYNAIFGWGTFNPVTWAGTFLVACFINTAIEGAVYRRFFSVPFRFKGIEFRWLLLANSFSVGVAIASIWISPVQL